MGVHKAKLRDDPAYAAMWAEKEATAAREKARLDDADRAQRERQRRDSMVAAGIPEKDVDAALADSLEHTESMKQARDWLASDERLFVMAGPRGVGKTTAAAWLACQVPGARFIDAVRLMRVDTYSDEAMGPLEQCPLLVLDELGNEYADVKGKLTSLVDGLINARYASMRRTVVTTNLDSSQFKLRYGERVADRIRETGRFYEVKGESMRGKKR